MNIFFWLGKKKGENLMVRAEEHMEIVKDSIHHLKESVRLFIDNDRKSLMESLSKLADKEHRADELRRSLLEDLSTGMVFSPIRGDLVMFINRVDSVSDWAHSAGRLLALLELKLPEDFTRGLIEFTGKSSETLFLLEKAFKEFVCRRYKSSLSICNEVEDREEEADDLKRGMLKFLLAGNFSPPYLVLLRELIEAIENIADMSEDSADILRILCIESM